MIYEFAMGPQLSMPQDTCHVFEVAARAGWVGQILGNGTAAWDVAGDPPLGPGGTKAGFQITMSRTTCCFTAGFTSAIPEPFDTTEFCFECPLATPTQSSSWGRLKDTYR